MKLRAQKISRRSVQVFLLAVILLGSLLAFSRQVFAVSEYDAPSCRWYHAPGYTTSISYTWGPNVYPGALFRAELEQAVADWNSTGVNFWFYEDGSSGEVFIDSYYDPYGQGGFALPYCSFSTTVGYDVYLNRAGAPSNSKIRRAESNHEIGHAHGVGHISGMEPAILGYNPDPTIYYVPQSPDIQLVNERYP
ncbi:MAG: hypothetical protein GX579_20360 [Chloroflexi bacterium]|nr:hypothetical protein [Chloroflexota bacterium]